MDNHNYRHDQSQNVHEVVRSLEDERVRQEKRARVALGLYASATADFLVADQGTHRYRHLLAYRREIAETHREVQGECGPLRGRGLVERLKAGGALGDCCLRAWSGGGEAESERRARAWITSD